MCVWTAPSSTLYAFQWGSRVGRGAGRWGRRSFRLQHRHMNKINSVEKCGGGRWASEAQFAASSNEAWHRLAGFGGLGETPTLCITERWKGAESWAVLDLFIYFRLLFPCTRGPSSQWDRVADTTLVSWLLLFINDAKTAASGVSFIFWKFARFLNMNATLRVPPPSTPSPPGTRGLIRCYCPPVAK